MFADVLGDPKIEMNGKIMVGIAFIFVVIAMFMLFLEYKLSWYYAVGSLIFCAMSFLFGYFGFKKWDGGGKK